MAIAYALSNNSIIPFDTNSPTVLGVAMNVSGITVGETLVGVDFRPQNGKLYGLGINEISNNATLYLVNPLNGLATTVGTPGAIAFVDVGGNPVDLQNSGIGIDFNPAVDRLRVTTANGLNFRINPNNGTPIDGNLNLSVNPPAGINPDGSINGASTIVDATAYTNSFPNAVATTQYTLDAASNSLFIQTLPNSGTQTNARTVTLAGAPLDFTNANGFDIPEDVAVAISNTPANGRALSLLTVGGVTSLYGIELSTGAASLLGSLGSGATPIQGFTVQNNLLGTPAIALDATATNLLRFNTLNPSVVSTVAISGVTVGETLVGIDFRPATGQLFGLGVNAVADNASLYLIDPQTGMATVVGAAGSINYVNAGGTTVDLPTSGYGIDFNPTVDRLRVTTDSGLNFRINPITGSPVDGNLNITVNPPAGINTDALINGSGSSGISATAYTNSFAQPLTVPAGPTTQYTLDSNTNNLLIQNPPNSGIQTVPLAVRLDGNVLDFGSVNGFDIPSSVSVATANSPAVGQSFAALTVGGSTNLYAINLANGNAISFGSIGSGASISGLAIADSVPLPVESASIIKRNTFGDGNLILGSNISDIVFGTNAGDTVAAFAGDDQIYGLGGNDSIDGGFGNDTIFGGVGNDTLIGNIGNDNLIGGIGVDNLFGGAGSDSFIFTSLADSNSDLIVDFTQLQDKLVIIGLGFNGIQSGAALGSLLGFSSNAGITTIVNAANTFSIRLNGTLTLTNSDFAF
jgi:Ca2+-binding RTX toxin-like protein